MQLGPKQILLFFLIASLTAPLKGSDSELPHIVLLMTDDMGWGQTGYYGHPILETPHLDDMAANGLRFDRFYAGSPNCSPTRASVLTGRSNDRTGVENHGFPLRLQEKTIAQALKATGYATGHFGKWHLNGLKGPGVPVLGGDSHSPGAFGFEDWLSATNFFDADPVLSREGEFEEFQGDSSEIIVEEALEFIRAAVEEGKPSFTVIWYGTPHSPFRALDSDLEPFRKLTPASAHHHGELVAMDRSIGTLRSGLRELGIAENTLVWFCSDNGGLSEIEPNPVGGLRDFKGSMYEGGIRVPAVVEWPAVIKAPRVTSYPAVTMDIFPTLAEITDQPSGAMILPIDGISLRRLFEEELGRREQPICFRHQGRAAIIDNDHKLVTQDFQNPKGPVFELFDLRSDPGESRNIIDDLSETARRLSLHLKQFLDSVDGSVAGEDYPLKKVDPNQPKRRFWVNEPAYEPFFEEWNTRWEYRAQLRKRQANAPQ